MNITHLFPGRPRPPPCPASSLLALSPSDHFPLLCWGLDTVWVWSELWFWCWMKRVVVPSMQAITKPPKMDRAERQRLWKRCLAWPGVSAEDFIRGWFFDADFDSISVVDCEAWLSWGLWGVTQDDLAIEVWFPRPILPPIEKTQ